MENTRKTDIDEPADAVPPLPVALAEGRVYGAAVTHALPLDTNGRDSEDDTRE